MSSVPLLFVSGGPGFSSAFEEQVLAAPLRQASFDPVFWSESWRAGGTPTLTDELGALEHQLRALGAESTTLVCHSFAAHEALLLLHRGLCPQRLVLISPTFDLPHLHRRILELAASDFEAQRRASDASAIRSLANQSRGFFDAPIQSALTLAAEDADLIRHYWRNTEAFQGFIASTSPIDAQFRPDAFFALSADLARLDGAHLRPGRSYALAADIVFGAADPVIDQRSATLDAERLFTCVQATILPDAGHWCHVERPSEFVRWLCASERQ